ncbi:MAG: GDSL-type esterase/lipase family protein [Desulfuromonadales bacterium]|nr:GDSL-type esterase/lipase family protein [Desulfuromonadales bacterium]
MKKGIGFLVLIACQMIIFGCGGDGSNDEGNQVPLPEKNLILELPQDQPEIIADFGDFTVSRIGSTFIEFDPLAGDLCDPVLYDREVDNFNFDGLYRVRSKSEVYFFRFGWQDCKNGYTRFIHVKWANDIAPATPGTMHFEAVDLPIVQTGSQEVTMIGDSITWNSDGESWRIRMARLNPDLRFIGSRTDTYGYGHEGEGGDGTYRVLDRLPGIVPSDHYLLLIGTNDRFSEEETVLNTQHIVEELLLKKDGARVTVLTLLPREDEFDARVQNVNFALREWAATLDPGGNVKLFDLGAAFRAQPDWQDLLPDGLHPGADGYQRLSELLQPLFSGS